MSEPAPAPAPPAGPRAALAERLVALADDELLLAHRNSEWTGHAPLLEEDIALANLAQDELGHATLLYEVAHELGADTPDRLVYARDAADWRNLRLVELPRGDWAFTMLRQFLFDLWETLWLPGLERSAHAPLADLATKVRREERFHLRHSALWLERLGLGTAESNARAQVALETLWPHAPQLFAPTPRDAELVAEGLLPDPAALEPAWRELAEARLRAAGLRPPAWPDGAPAGRDAHTEHLAPLLAELQEVARADPEATW